MKSINPDDFKVVNAISLSHLPTELPFDTDDEIMESIIYKLTIDKSQ